VRILCFFYYWETLSLTGAFAEWVLACWAFGAPEHLATHAIAMAVLFTVNRVAAVAFEIEDTFAPLRHRVGAVVLATGFTAAGGTAGLVVSAVAWAAVVRAGGL